jgi:hypothetical protein
MSSSSSSESIVSSRQAVGDSSPLLHPQQGSDASWSRTTAVQQASKVHCAAAQLAELLQSALALVWPPLPAVALQAVCCVGRGAGGFPGVGVVCVRPTGCLC